MKTLRTFLTWIWVLVASSPLVFMYGWALVEWPIPVAACTAIFAGLLVTQFRRVARVRNGQKKLAEIVFERAYGQLLPAPAFEVHRGYGVYRIVVKFCSRPEMEAAAEQNNVFISELGRVFKDLKYRGDPFSADKAIFFTYEGHDKELLARARATKRVIQL